VWKHFIKADDYATSKKVTCKYCNATLTATGGSTSSLIAHLQRKHPGVLDMPDGVEPFDK
jgi:hypothetical protein